MARPHQVRLHADELERRDTPTSLAYTVPTDGLPNEITIRLESDTAGDRVVVFDNGAPAASQLLSEFLPGDEVLIVGAAGEQDTIVVDYSTGYFTVPVRFDGGLGGAAGTVTAAGATVALNFGASAETIEADIEEPTTTVTFAGGDGVTVIGTVAAVTGTSGDDTFLDHTPVEQLDLVGGPAVFDPAGALLPDGNDTYVLDPGSNITIGDAGGNDRIDFSQQGNPAGIVADIGPGGTFVTVPDPSDPFGPPLGTVVFGGPEGAIETLVGTGLDDVYNIALGGDITIIDGDGLDTIDFGGTDLGIQAILETDLATVSGAGGELTFEGTAETVIGTDFADTFRDEGDVDFTFDGGGGRNTYDLQPGSTLTIRAGANDKIDLSRADFGVTANLATGQIKDSANNLVNIESGRVGILIGTRFADVIIGDELDNVFTIGSGDIVEGLGGNDRYVIIPDGGETRVIDAAGVNAIDFSRAPLGVKFDLGRTNGSPQKVDAAGSRVRLTGAANILIGSAFADDLSGSNGNDVILGGGGGGGDTIQGQSGRDILVGGRGADRLNGGPGEDILIAGYTVYDDPADGLPAWSAIQDVWGGSGSTASRVAAIRAGVVTDTGTYRLKAAGAGATVVNDDGAADKLTGASGANWFFYLPVGPTRDTITDINKGDYLNDS